MSKGAKALIQAYRRRDRRIPESLGKTVETLAVSWPIRVKCPTCQAPDIASCWGCKGKG